MTEWKICSKCKSEKHITQFSKNCQAKDKLHSHCKSCKKDKKFKTGLNYQSKKLKIWNFGLYTSKKCSLCRETKFIDDFSVSRNNSDGFDNYCKKCVSNKRKIWEENNRKKGISSRSHKKCFRCKETKSISDFNIARTSKDGYTKDCKQCQKMIRSSKHEQKKAENESWRSKLALYKSWHNKLTIEESPQASHEGFLKVKCANCRNYTIPTNQEVSARVASLNHAHKFDLGDRKIYCSDECKQSCPIYWQYLYPKGFAQYKFNRPVQRELKKECFERDGSECQICGAKLQLVCHHIEGTVKNPIESADLDLVITVCKKCHKYIHTLPGCGYSEMQCRR